VSNNINYDAEKRKLYLSKDIIDKYLEIVFSLRGIINNDDVRKEFDEYVYERGEHWMKKFDSMDKYEMFEYMSSKMKSLREELESKVNK
jgi:hypothetical protein